MQTNKDLMHATRGGLAFSTPKGSRVEPVPNEPGVYWVSPYTYARDSIERHDATYYGIRVRASDVEVSPPA